jgi:hypothetical protein
LYYSKTDVNRAKSELKQLKIRTYSDLSWKKEGGRDVLFGDWQKANKYNYKNVPNSCYVRNAILIIQSIVISYTDKCVIQNGKWQNPYTNNIILTKTDIDIDHIVPLKNTWDSGAYLWTQENRVKYANSPFVLIISDKPSNRQKSDKSPDKWLPPNNKCGYIVKWINIKYDYKLTITSSENTKLQQEITNC